MASSSSSSPALNIHPIDDFSGVCILEKTPHGNLHLAWSCINQTNNSSSSSSMTSVILSRANVQEPVISRFGNRWLYSVAVSTNLPSAVLPKCTAYSIVVVSCTFSPERLLTLANALSSLYFATGTPVSVEAGYLSALSYNRVPKSIAPSSTGCISRAAIAALSPSSDIAWDGAAFDPSRAWKPTQCRSVFTNIGVETVVVWTALMLGKQVAVYGAEISKVIRCVRLLPLLMVHRYPVAAAAAGVILKVPATTTTTTTSVSTPSDMNTPASLMFPLVTLSDYHFTRGALVDNASTNVPTTTGGGGSGVGVVRSPNAINLDGSMLLENGGANNDTASTRVGGGYLAASLSAEIAAGVAAQIADLKTSASYVAGFIDPSILSRGGDLWDVCVDLVSRTVIVAESSKAELSMSSVHKEVAKALVEALEDTTSSASSAAGDAYPLIAVAGKTTAIVDRLATWLPNGIHGAGGDVAVAFQETLRKEGIPPATTRFLWGVATSEPRLRK